MLRFSIVLHSNGPAPGWWLGDDILFKFDTETISQVPILSFLLIFLFSIFVFGKGGGGLITNQSTSSHCLAPSHPHHDLIIFNRRKSKHCTISWQWGSGIMTMRFGNRRKPQHLHRAISWGQDKSRATRSQYHHDRTIENDKVRWRRKVAIWWRRDNIRMTRLFYDHEKTWWQQENIRAWWTGHM